MTFLSSYAIRPGQAGSGRAPCHLDLSDLSLVVPVYNNRQGAQQLLATCLDVFSPRRCPREIIIVDSLSVPPLAVPRFASWGLPLQVLSCPRPSAAAARNLGARTATGSWVLFLDSDCLPTPTLIEGYERALSGCIGYLGHPFEKETPWAYIALRFLSVRWYSAIEVAGEWFSCTRENRRVWAADHQRRHA